MVQAHEVGWRCFSSAWRWELAFHWSARERWIPPGVSPHPTQTCKPGVAGVRPPQEATFVHLSLSSLPEVGPLGSCLRTRPQATSSPEYLGPVRVTLSSPDPQ